MIWESIAVMTMLDLAFITIAVVGLGLLHKARRQWPGADRPLGPALIAVGLGILGLFYSVDLLVMFVLPGVVGSAQAMVTMEQLHLNYSWLAFLTSGMSVAGGAALTFRTVARSTAELEWSQRRLSATHEQARHDLQATRERYFTPPENERSGQ